MLEVRSPRVGATFSTKIVKTGANAEKAYIRADGLGRPSTINMNYNFVAEGAAVNVFYCVDNPRLLNDPETAAGLTWINVGSAPVGDSLLCQTTPTGFRFDFSAPAAILVTCS